MASEKRLQKASARFKKGNSGLYMIYSKLVSSAAAFIRLSGAPEVIVGIKSGEYYEFPNN